MRERCDKLLALAHESGMDAVLVTSQINRQYFSGFTGSNAVILITDTERILYTDFRYTIQANIQSGKYFTIREEGRALTPELIISELDRLGCQSCGYEDTAMTVSQFKKYGESHIEMLPASSLMQQIRIIKSADEIENICAAQRCSDKAFAELLKSIKPGLTEKDVAIELDYLLRKNGADENSFDTIVGSGPNSALCHATPSKRQLQKGDLVVIDFGSRVNGYCSDMTRTIAIGEPCDELKKIYNIVLAAHLFALKSVKPGINCKYLDSIARSYIKDHGYGDNFGHSLGHGFGLEVHEAPNASPNYEGELKSGMTITIEPGIYIEGLGGVRIEDCVIVSDDGCINPVTTTKKLIVID